MEEGERLPDEMEGRMHFLRPEKDTRGHTPLQDTMDECVGNLAKVTVHNRYKSIRESFDVA